MAFQDSVIACECWARDGLQSVARVVPTAHKLEMLHGIQEAGFKKLEVTSFSHPRYLPQFADGEEVLKRLARRPGVSYVVLMPNEKGFERFERCVKEGHGADEIILMISASERHNLANFRLPHAAAFRTHARLMERARTLGVKVIGCTGTVYGCPIMGDVPMADVVKVARFYIEAGAESIMLGDTTGNAHPLLVRERLGELRARWPRTEFIAHFHDTRGTGVVNTVAALELGLRHVDTSIGAIGGQPATGASPYQLGFTGNVSSEDLLAMLEEMGIRTGVDIDRLIRLGQRAEAILGQPLRANIIRSGRVPHTPRPYDPGSREDPTPGPSPS